MLLSKVFTARFNAACSSDLRVLATESNSSTKSIQGERRFATSNVLSIFLEVSHKY